MQRERERESEREREREREKAHNVPFAAPGVSGSYAAMGEFTPLHTITLYSCGRMPICVIWTREVLPSRFEVIRTVWPPGTSSTYAAWRESQHSTAQHGALPVAVVSQPQSMPCVIND